VIATSGEYWMRWLPESGPQEVAATEGVFMRVKSRVSNHDSFHSNAAI